MRWLATTNCWCSIYRLIAPGPPSLAGNYSARRAQELIAHGEAQTFDAAKAAAERAFDKL
jgi:hypothetical protein